MRFDPERYHRRSIRLDAHDYARSCMYFVTIGTQDQANLFGEVSRGVVLLNEGGTMVQDVWNALPDHYLGIEIDTFVVMPSHVHGLILISGTGSSHGGATASPLSLPEAVQRFKSLTTRRYIDGVTQRGWPVFNRRLWHRNYHERIVRSEEEIAAYRTYIRQNPARWGASRSHSEA